VDRRGAAASFGSRPQTNQGEPRDRTIDATAYRWLSIMWGGHSGVTQFRNQEDTGGLERTRRARRLRQEDTQGTAGVRKDTPLCRFGTVRPRVQIPGPRPISELRISESDGSQAVAGSQGGHRFSWNLVVAAPSKWIADRRLNSLTALAQPIYQHAHGPRTVRHQGSKIRPCPRRCAFDAQVRTVRHRSNPAGSGLADFFQPTCPPVYKQLQCQWS